MFNKLNIMENLEKLKSLLKDSYTMKEKFKNEYRKYKNSFILDIFRKELQNNNNLNLIISSYQIQRYEDLTWDYFLSFSNNNINEKEMLPLFNKKEEILKKAINKEIEILNLKLNNLDEYIKILYELEENNFFNQHFKDNDNISVVNSFWEDVTNAEINKDYIEYSIKYLLNFLTEEKKYDLEQLQYHKVYLEKINKDNKNIDLYNEDFFINEAEILTYEKRIFPDILEVKNYFLDTKEKKYFYKDFKETYLNEEEWIKILAPIVTTLTNLKDTIKLTDNIADEFYDEEYTNDIKNTIELIINNKNDFFIKEWYWYLKSDANLSSLNNLIIEMFIQNYSFTKEEIIKIRELSVSIKIEFSNYKN